MSIASKVKVRVHKAFFKYNPEEYYFINIQNNFKRRYLKLTGIWIWTGAGPFRTNWGSIDNKQRPVPAILYPKSEWETWIPVSKVGNDAAFRNVTVEINKHYLTSRKRKDVAPVGVPPGGNV